MTGKLGIATLCGLFLSLSPSLATAVPVTVTINQIDIDDRDHDLDPSATLYHYMVSNVLFGNAFIPVDAVPHVGVCAVRIPSDNAAGCQNRITPNPGEWSFTRDVDPALGTVDILIQVRNQDAVQGNFPLDLSPGFLAPAQRGLPLTVNLTDGSWRVLNDPAVNPTTAQSSVFATTNQNPNIMAARVTFSVSFCAAGAAACSNGSQVVCAGSACAASHPNPACSAGTVSCTGGTYACVPTVLDVPEQQNDQDDDCDFRLDECNASQIGQTFACVGQANACPGVPGIRTCTTPEEPPGPCVHDANVCQTKCASEVNVSTVPELREAIAQAALTPCKDVIVLAPGSYDLDSPLLINDSMEIRGVGSSLDCQGLDLDTALAANQLDHNLGSFFCDGDGGEDPAATVIRNILHPASELEEVTHRVMVIGDNAFPATARTEVTLRHLTITGGHSTVPATPGSGLYAPGPSRLKLFNVVVEDNVARGPGVGIVHFGDPWDYPVVPTFVMVNSTVRRNRSLTPPIGGVAGAQGSGGGIRLSGVAFILRSTISDNAAIRGAGIFMQGALHVYNSTFTRNFSGQRGAGIFIDPLLTSSQSGDGFLELRNSTITNNIAQWFIGQEDSANPGAGVWASGCTASDTCPGHVTRVETYGNVIADNLGCLTTETDSPNDENCSTDAGGYFVTLGSNVGSADCSFSANVSLPGSGMVPGDRVVNLGYARDAIGPVFPNPFRDALRAFCDIGWNATPMGASNAALLSAAMLQALEAMPSGNRDVHDFVVGQNVHLFGDLAEQGGPTQTIALSVSSPAILVGHSSEDPGFVTDGFPSSVPLCPSADQRLFTLAGGAAPVSCDAGSYQTLGTAALSADAAAARLSLLFPDSDGDGIADSIDSAPATASTAFSDEASGGRMTGAIQSRGDQSVLLFDAFPNPQAGIVALALSSGGTTPAQITACNGCVQLVLNAGETKLASCPASCVFANAGPDQVLECTAAGRAVAQLDASTSYDTSGAAVTFAWSAPGITFSNPTVATPTASFPLGPTTATVAVSSAPGGTASDSLQIAVVDRTRPVIAVPPDVTITSCTNANIGTATAIDACQGSVTVTNNKPAKFPLGTTTVTYTAVDAFGNVATATQRVTAVLGDSSSCCPAGTTIRTGTSGNDTITGTSASECILGLGGQDTINGAGGNDYISGGDGDDVIDGGSGNDRIYGGAGQDQLRGGTGTDVVEGGAGDDRCWGGDQDDVMRGGLGQDQLFGEAGNDQLFGDDGDDRLEGGDGNDALDGGAHQDACIGGFGTDTFGLCETATQ